jgi:predicted aspartyl protease
MGYTYVDLTLAGRARKKVRALVDTGSTYVVVDPKTISEVGLQPTPFETDLTLADKRKIRAKLYVAEAEVEGRRGPVFVAEWMFPPHCWVFTLWRLGLKPNPLTGKWEVIGPEGGYLL